MSWTKFLSALDEQKTVIPVICRDCAIPFRLRRVQYVDFREDYARGVQQLLRTLAVGPRAGSNGPAITGVESLAQAKAEAEQAARVAEEESRNAEDEEKARREADARGSKAERNAQEQQAVALQRDQDDQSARMALKTAWF